MTFKHKLSRRLALLKDASVLLALAGVACERALPPLGLTSGASPVRLVVSPKAVTLLPSQSVDFTAVGLTAVGDTAPNVTVTWSVTSGSISDWGSQGGRHYGHYQAGANPGTYRVIATGHPGNLADTALVTVTSTSTPVASVSVAPASAVVPVGGTVQLTATPKDANGNALTGRTVTWSSSATSVATVDGSGLVTGVGAGSATITATSEGRSGSSVITVTATSVPVASVSVTPASATVQVGGTVQLTATPKDANGNALAGRTIAWASSNTSVATVSGTGLVTGLAVGSVTITATSEGKSGTASITVTAPPPPGSSVVFVGAGDIAGCSQSNDEATAQLLDGISGTVFTAGDNAYSDGTDANFSQCYDPTWGRHKARTRPSPGNHDYHTSGAAGYYNYFGANAGPSGRGYYSYDLGDWHIISLNSNVSMSAGSAQEQWLRGDLAASTKQCAIAYWHHPRFSSGSHGSSTASQPLWQALYDAGAEIVIVGHDHNYQRFAPQTPGGQADPAKGIREFVAGMGGQSHYNFSSPIANTEAYNTDTYGVLKLTLGPGTYSWEFIPVAGKTYTDSGSGTCH